MSSVSLSFEEFEKIIGMGEKNKSAFDEAVEFNIFREYNGIKQNKSYEKSNYSHGLMLMLEYVINCVKNDKENGDYYSEENNDIAIKGGKLLYESGGIDTMHEVLLTWIPKRYRREIDMKWDGIGEWQG
jgi:hypothetical protein